MKKTCRSIESLADTAKHYIETLKTQDSATVVGLSGDLGSGKTTFTKEVARILGVTDVITSPTFVIQKRYKLKKGALYSNLIHIDAYRLEGAADLSVLRWDELLADPGNLIFIEWPELVRGALPKDAHTIHFTFVDETTRTIEW
jgi:tRNA threonylcarbamoyladenosine biosynthesis protein TsaE